MRGSHDLALTFFIPACSSLSFSSSAQDKLSLISAQFKALVQFSIRINKQHLAGTYFIENMSKYKDSQNLIERK